jgi:hypothetical protein
MMTKLRTQVDWEVFRAYCNEIEPRLRADLESGLGFLERTKIRLESEKPQTGSTLMLVPKNVGDGDASKKELKVHEYKFGIAIGVAVNDYDLSISFVPNDDFEIPKFEGLANGKYRIGPDYKRFAK